MTVHTVGEFVAILAIVVPVALILTKVIMKMTEGNFSIRGLFSKPRERATYVLGYGEHKHSFSAFFDEDPNEVIKGMTYEWDKGCDACFKNKVAKEVRHQKDLRDQEEAKAKLAKAVEKELKKKKRAKK